MSRRHRHLPSSESSPFLSSVSTHPSLRDRLPRCRFAIVQPAEHSKLAVQDEGLAVLRGIKGSVCPVAVIGPYRSGKSFTLNQLMGVGCGEFTRTRRRMTTDMVPSLDEALQPVPPALTLSAPRSGHRPLADVGFGMGHTRLTQTKGVWIWGEPVPVQLANGETTNVSRGGRGLQCCFVPAETLSAVCLPAYLPPGDSLPLCVCLCVLQLLFIDTEVWQLNHGCFCLSYSLKSSVCAVNVLKGSRPY